MGRFFTPFLAVTRRWSKNYINKTIVLKNMLFLIKKEESSRPASREVGAKRNALVLVKGNRPGLSVQRRAKRLTPGQRLIIARDEYFARVRGQACG